ncbi:MAG: DinB family protein [Gemmatimonadaceae bacterium]
MIPYGGPELAKAFRTVRGNTIQIAEEIPEDQYAFVAAPGVRSVGTLLVHIAFSSMLQDDVHRVKRLTTFAGYDFGAFMGALAAEEQKQRTKGEIILALRLRGDDFAGWLETLTPEFLSETFTDHAGQNERTRFEGLLSPKEHEMHHRGQLMLIERMIGVVPHLTRAMQARMAARA